MQNNRYSDMQKHSYDIEAATWSPTNRNPIVGTFDEHNAWKDYDDYLFIGAGDTSKKVALDFGCGPGRNIVRFNTKFARIDGVDISDVNLIKAKEWIDSNGITYTGQLFGCNGYDLRNVASELYDVVFSTICFQHICVHEIRLNYLKEFFRVLKPGGNLTIQMGYGFRPAAVDYYSNMYNATVTNGRCDTMVTKPEQLEKDLTSVGFVEFQYHLRPTGPGDLHTNWIFFNCNKK